MEERLEIIAVLILLGLFVWEGSPVPKSNCQLWMPGVGRDELFFLHGTTLVSKLKELYDIARLS
jgi:hypothetical protein